MYRISEKEPVQTLVRQARDIAVNIKSIMFDEDVLANAYQNSDGTYKTIYENISIVFGKSRTI